jgi:hypothetical protein
MLSVPLSKTTSSRYILYFLAGWTVLNILQASTLGVHSDEAYYWVYSRFLDWGYYDHPPMVALFIRIGDSILANELGLRLVTIIASTISIYVLWLTARKYNADVRWFIAFTGGLLAFQVYGFITTPDSPLLFFAILFYYFYERYLEKDSWVLALVLAIVITLMLYSKYHAVLLLFFTLLANFKILKRLSLWLIPVAVIALYMPHILWQIHHNYPSVNYHLFERSSATYQFSRTLEYAPGQLLMAGPLVGWFFFYYGFGIRIKDDYIRCLLFNSIGIFIFFWLNTVKGNVQPHWTLIGFIPLLLLTLIRLKQTGTAPSWLFKLALANASVIIVFRLLLIAGVPVIRNLPFTQNYYHYDDWARQIKQQAGNAYVVMPVGFQPASRYNYYTRSLKGFAYDVANYRRTQYDIWPIEDSLQNKKVFYTSYSPLPGFKVDSFKTVYGTWFGAWVNHVRTYQKIDIKLNSYNVQAKPGQQMTFDINILNPYNKTVNFGNTAKQDSVTLRAVFYQEDDLVSTQNAGTNFNQISILPNQTASYSFKCTAPIKKGKYRLIFSMYTQPFMGGRNSRIVTFTVQ